MSGVWPLTCTATTTTRDSPKLGVSSAGGMRAQGPAEAALRATVARHFTANRAEAMDKEIFGRRRAKFDPPLHLLEQIGAAGIHGSWRRAVWPYRGLLSAQ